MFRKADTVVTLREDFARIIYNWRVSDMKSMALGFVAHMNKDAYQALLEKWSNDDMDWDSLSENSKDLYRARADDILKLFWGWLGALDTGMVDV